MSVPPSEGWGGTALRNHYIVGGRSICGRTPLSFEPTIYADHFSESDRARHPEQYCQFCSRAVDASVKFRSLDAHRALVEQVRTGHLQHVPLTPQGTDSWCYRCRLPWPCDAVRLAEGATQQSSVTLDAKVNQTIFDLMQERDATLACLERAERERVEIRGHYDAVREQVIVVTQRLAAARKALREIAATATQWVDTPHAGQLLRQIEQEARVALAAPDGAGESEP